MWITLILCSVKIQDTKYVCSKGDPIFTYMYVYVTEKIRANSSWAIAIFPALF